MLLNTLQFGAGGKCVLAFEEEQQWLRATWTGLVGNYEAMQGAQAYLGKVKPLACAYLLNDNLALRGPWFNSVEWLEHTWLPQAQRLGLRYIAHVVQDDTHADVLTLTLPQHVSSSLELQLFHELSAAEQWLHTCQELLLGPGQQPPSTGKA
jgi:hypothetical protein